MALDGVPVGRTTRGHRFLSPGEICVGSAAEYVEKLQHAYVIVDQDRRKELIRAELDRRAAELGSPSSPIPACSTRSPGSPNFRSCSPARSMPIS